MRIGTDIVQIARIEAAVARHGDRFIDRFLSREERIRLTSRPESLAGYWAAKEAIAKALGCGIGRELGWHDIVLDKDARGAPSFRLRSEAAQRFALRSGSLSISHDGGFAIAVVAIDLSRD